ncbi:MAG: ribonuclease III [Methylacidiphilales bacterium]|nr:ribonuclease III [Candidatus Methylacidiphilales bacterium]
MHPPSPHPIENLIPYTFRNPQLLTLALTHPSASPTHTSHNQRLEYLGDAILQFIVSAWLYETLPHAPEGRLTSLRAALVNRHQLASWARTLNLQHHLITDKKNSTIATQTTVLAAACEALIGALYLDGGIPIAETFIRHHLQNINLEPLLTHHNPKGLLQEYLQKQKSPPPTYHLIQTDGPPHRRTYTVEVRYLGHTAQATATSKKAAETAAARTALKTLGLLSD